MTSKIKTLQNDLEYEEFKEELVKMTNVYLQLDPSKSLLDHQLDILNDSPDEETIIKLKKLLADRKEMNQNIFEKIEKLKSTLDEHNEKVIQKEMKNIELKNPDIRRKEKIEVMKQAENLIRLKKQMLGKDINIPYNFRDEYGKEAESEKNDKITKTGTIPNSNLNDTKKYLKKKTEDLLHKLVLEELHFKRLFKLYENLKYENQKIGIRKTHIYNPLPDKRFFDDNNRVLKYERKIYQFVGGFCNRGNLKVSHAYKPDTYKDKNKPSVSPAKNGADNKSFHDPELQNKFFNKYRQIINDPQFMNKKTKMNRNASTNAINDKTLKKNKSNNIIKNSFNNTVNTTKKTDRDKKNYVVSKNDDTKKIDKKKIKIPTNSEKESILNRNKDKDLVEKHHDDKIDIDVFKKKNANLIKNQKDSNIVKNTKNSHIIQTQKDSNLINNKKESDIYNKKDSKGINEKYSNIKINQEDSKIIQNKKDSNIIDNKKDSKVINQQDSNIINNKKDSKVNKQHDSNIINNKKDSKVINEQLSNIIDNKKDSKVINQQDSKIIQNKKDSNIIDNKKDSKEINQQDSKIIQNKKDSNIIDNKKDSKVINQEDSKIIQSKKDSNIIDNKKDSKVINQQDSNIINNKKDSKVINQKDSNIINNKKNSKVINEQLSNIIDNKKDSKVINEKNSEKTIKKDILNNLSKEDIEKLEKSSKTIKELSEKNLIENKSGLNLDQRKDSFKKTESVLIQKKDLSEKNIELEKEKQETDKIKESLIKDINQKEKKLLINSLEKLAKESLLSDENFQDNKEQEDFLNSQQKSGKKINLEDLDKNEISLLKDLESNLNSIKVWNEKNSDLMGKKNFGFKENPKISNFEENEKTDEETKKSEKDIKKEDVTKDKKKEDNNKDKKKEDVKNDKVKEDITKEDIIPKKSEKNIKKDDGIASLENDLESKKKEEEKELMSLDSDKNIVTEYKNKSNLAEMGDEIIKSSMIFSEKETKINSLKMDVINMSIETLSISNNLKNNIKEDNQQTMFNSFVPNENNTNIHDDVFQKEPPFHSYDSFGKGEEKNGFGDSLQIDKIDNKTKSAGDNLKNSLKLEKKESSNSNKLTSINNIYPEPKKNNLSKNSQINSLVEGGEMSLVLSKEELQNKSQVTKVDKKEDNKVDKKEDNKVDKKNQFTAIKDIQVPGKEKDLLRVLDTITNSLPIDNLKNSLENSGDQNKTGKKEISLLESEKLNFEKKKVESYEKFDNLEKRSQKNIDNYDFLNSNSNLVTNKKSDKIPENLEKGKKKEEINFLESEKVITNQKLTEQPDIDFLQSNLKISKEHTDYKETGKESINLEEEIAKNKLKLSRKSENDEILVSSENVNQKNRLVDLDDRNNSDIYNYFKTQTARNSLEDSKYLEKNINSLKNKNEEENKNKEKNINSLKNKNEEENKNKEKNINSLKNKNEEENKNKEKNNIEEENKNEPIQSKISKIGDPRNFSLDLKKERPKFDEKDNRVTLNLNPEDTIVQDIDKNENQEINLNDSDFFIKLNNLITESNGNSNIYNQMHTDLNSLDHSKKISIINSNFRNSNLIKNNPADIFDKNTLKTVSFETRNSQSKNETNNSKKEEKNEDLKKSEIIEESGVEVEKGNLISLSNLAFENEQVILTTKNSII